MSLDMNVTHKKIAISVSAAQQSTAKSHTQLRVLQNISANR